MHSDSPIRRFVATTASVGIACAALIFIAHAMKQPAVVYEAPPIPQNTSSAAPASSTSSSMPPSVLVKVPFSPQAPFAVWDPLHEEACEEMALIMIKHYLEGTPLSRETAEQEVQDLVAWEHDHGFGEDLNARDLAAIGREHYGLPLKAVYGDAVTIDSIKAQLAKGLPVLVPAAGRDLGNPYFSGLGPWYHAIVVTGYDAKNFITNDPGTRRGESYKYSSDVLSSAIHDWTGVKEEIRAGGRAMIVIER